MIDYDPGTWGLKFILQCYGSVFPKSLAWAIPNAICGMVIHMYMKDENDDIHINLEGVDIMWSGYTFVLGFLMVFRNNQAYTRFWEGGTLVNQMRGEWMNATSSLLAFCTTRQDRRDDVSHFQQLLIRLMSMLHCSALQQVADLEDDSMELLSTKGMNDDSLKFLEQVPDKCEVLVQWIQRLIVEANEKNLFVVAPPILSRAFQEIGRGIVNLSNARKIRDIPFPFPYAQMITCMLLIHWLVTPLMASYYITRIHWVGISCFCVTAAMWSLVYIAIEIDQPFGNDPNDLPVSDMQKDFNEGLKTLLKPEAQAPPGFQFIDSVDVRRSLSVTPSGKSLATTIRATKRLRSSSRGNSKLWNMFSSHSKDWSSHMSSRELLKQAFGSSGLQSTLSGDRLQSSGSREEVLHEESQYKSSVSSCPAKQHSGGGLSKSIDTDAIPEGSQESASERMARLLVAESPEEGADFHPVCDASYELREFGLSASDRDQRRSPRTTPRKDAHSPRTSPSSVMDRYLAEVEASRRSVGSDSSLEKPAHSARVPPARQLYSAAAPPPKLQFPFPSPRLSPDSRSNGHSSRAKQEVR